jgi:CheY-like chemotaxis protein
MKNGEGNEMRKPGAGVLFVGEYPAVSASLTRVLNSLGCECRYAETCEEALAAMEKRKFRVVLSKSKLSDGNARKLIPTIEAASGWLFLSFPVEDGCWWIPAMENGQLCVEAVALHSREFSKSLVNILKTILAPVEAQPAAGSSAIEQPSRAVYAGSY